MPSTICVEQGGHLGEVEHPSIRVEEGVAVEGGGHRPAVEVPQFAVELTMHDQAGIAGVSEVRGHQISIGPMAGFLQPHHSQAVDHLTLLSQQPAHLIAFLSLSLDSLLNRRLHHDALQRAPLDQPIQKTQRVFRITRGDGVRQPEHRVV